MVGAPHAERVLEGSSVGADLVAQHGRRVNPVANTA
jgi:hypothetical protein